MDQHTYQETENQAVEQDQHLTLHPELKLLDLGQVGQTTGQDDDPRMNIHPTKLLKKNKSFS